MVARALVVFILVWIAVTGILYLIYKLSPRHIGKVLKFLTISGITATIAAVVLFFFVQIF